MNDVTIYTTTTTAAYMADECGTRYSLQPWGSNAPYYEGHDDGGERYELPAGYTVGEDATGMPAIFDPAGGHCGIFNHAPTGRPQLFSLADTAPVLRRIT